MLQAKKVPKGDYAFTAHDIIQVCHKPKASPAGFYLAPNVNFYKQRGCHAKKILHLWFCYFGRLREAFWELDIHFA